MISFARSKLQPTFTLFCQNTRKMRLNRPEISLSFFFFNIFAYEVKQHYDGTLQRVTVEGFIYAILSLAMCPLGWACDFSSWIAVKRIFKKAWERIRFPLFFSSNKHTPSLWDNYGKIAGVHPPIVRCSCTKLMGSWNLQPSSFLPCQLMLRRQTWQAQRVILIHNWNFHLKCHSQKWVLWAPKAACISKAWT